MDITLMFDIHAGTQLTARRFSQTMTDEEFICFLKSEGLSCKDCRIIKGETLLYTCTINLSHHGNAFKLYR